MKSKNLIPSVFIAIIPLGLFYVSTTAGILFILRSFLSVILRIFLEGFGVPFSDTFILVAFAFFATSDMLWAATLISNQEKANDKKVTESFEGALVAILESTEKLTTPLIALLFSFIIFALANETVGVSKIVGLSITVILTIAFTFIFLVMDKSEINEGIASNQNVE